MIADVLNVWSSVYHMVPVARASTVYTTVYAHITLKHTDRQTVDRVETIHRNPLRGGGGGGGG